MSYKVGLNQKEVFSLKALLFMQWLNRYSRLVFLEPIYWVSLNFFLHTVLSIHLESSYLKNKWLRIYFYKLMKYNSKHLFHFVYLIISLGKMEGSLKSDDCVLYHVYKSSEVFKIHLVFDNKVFSYIRSLDPWGTFKFAIYIWFCSFSGNNTFHYLFA